MEKELTFTPANRYPIVPHETRVFASEHLMGTLC